MYATMVIDPPWAFEKYSGPGIPTTAVDDPYPVMSNADIAALPIQPMLHQHACVFMWATMPLLDVAIDIGKGWGLTYKTVAFTWVKVNESSAHAWFNRPMSTDIWFNGMGYWTRSNVELVLLFTQGRPRRRANDVGQIVATPRGRHSEKPEEVQTRIERLVAGPYAELFARRCRQGWDCYGNEINGMDIRDAIREVT